MAIPYLNRNQVTTPPAGYYTLFYDLDNGSVLTSKDNACVFESLDELPSVDISKLDDCICEVTKQIVDDAGCAMTKGLIDSTSYQSITNNINLFSNVTVDPSTGGYSHSITTSPTLFVTLVITNALCNGGSTGTGSATITGGTGPYTQVWADMSATPVNNAALPAGSFTLTVTDANGTVKVITFIVTEPTALVLPAPVVQGVTPAATATALPSGGTPLYTYVWKDNLGIPIGQTTQVAIALSSGTYQVEVTDANACTIEDTNVVIA
jgi:hypothetical protein